MKSLMGVMPEHEIIISRKIGKEKVLKVVRYILRGIVACIVDKIDRLATQVDQNTTSK